MMFSLLLSEVESISSAYGYDTIDSIEFIRTHLVEYSHLPEFVEEFKLFLEHGKEILG
jgi:hypothetical protein